MAWLLSGSRYTSQCPNTGLEMGLNRTKSTKAFICIVIWQSLNFPPSYVYNDKLWQYILIAYYIHIFQIQGYSRKGKKFRLFRGHVPLAPFFFTCTNQTGMHWNALQKQGYQKISLQTDGLTKKIVRACWVFLTFCLEIIYLAGRGRPPLPW